MKKKTKIQELEERITRLENMLSKPIQPIPPHIHQWPVPPNSNLHYHGTTPCYQNPCIWC